MFDFKPLTVEHIKLLVDEPMNKDLQAWFDAGNGHALQKESEGFTVFYNGEVMMVGGLVRMWNKRAYLWTVLSERLKNHSIPVYRGLRDILWAQKAYDRIEMDVPLDLEIAHRRARFMGFQCECGVAKKFSPKGEDRSLYAWVRES